MDCKKHSAIIWSFIKFNKAPMYSIMRLAPAQTSGPVQAASTACTVTVNQSGWQGRRERRPGRRRQQRPGTDSHTLQGRSGRLSWTSGTLGHCYITLFLAIYHLGYIAPAKLLYSKGAISILCYIATCYLAILWRKVVYSNMLYSFAAT